MKYKWVLMIVVLVVISLIPETAYAQVLDPTTDLDIAALASGFGDWEFWVTILATLIAGAAGGVVYELITLQGNIEIYHKLDEDEIAALLSSSVKAKFLIDFGIWARVIIGALAALSVLFVFSPPTTIALISMAVIAGSAGSAIFGALQDRLKALLAIESKEEMGERIDDIEVKINMVLEIIQKQKKTQQSPSGSKTILPPGPDLKSLESIEQLLFEAKGIHEAIRK
jgi:hypothetical protein